MPGTDYLAASRAPSSAALQVPRLTIEENLWNLRADPARGGPAGNDRAAVTPAHLFRWVARP